MNNTAPSPHARFPFCTWGNRDTTKHVVSITISHLLTKELGGDLGSAESLAVAGSPCLWEGRRGGIGPQWGAAGAAPQMEAGADAGRSVLGSRQWSRCCCTGRPAVSVRNHPGRIYLSTEEL